MKTLESALFLFLQRARDLYQKTFVQIATAMLAVVFLSAFLIHFFEGDYSNANINSVWDGIWWAVVTVGTVGYGDKYPITLGGRLVGIILIFLGVGLMSLFTATIASALVERRMKEDKGLDTVKTKNHVVICGWNQYTPEVLTGLTRYAVTVPPAIILINELPVDEVETLRLKYEKYPLKFLRGDYVHEEVLVRANVAAASFVLIMADLSGAHHRDRLDERTTLAALTIKSLAPHVRTAAELINGENRSHLKRANVDEIIVRGEHVGAFLASAFNSPGLPKAISSMVSLGDTNKFWRRDIPPGFVGRSFGELSAYYREKERAILVGLLKEKKTIRLEDLLTDNTSVIDVFIREKLREAKRDFTVERDSAQVMINPEDNHVIEQEDVAIVLSKTPPH